MSDATRRIAMWSGPRNISTAMMRAWENRGDTAVWDEPFYAYFLARTGIAHPGADEVVAAGETDWRKVVQRLLGPVPGGHPVFFQKLMTHHLLPEVGRDWLVVVTNCFLIRDPREVIRSYARVRPELTAADLGIPQQVALFDHVSEATGSAPIVLDAGDVCARPRAVLEKLCARLGLAFTERMLSWPAGPRASDGVWAAHWYGSVQTSTGFAPPGEHSTRLADEHQDLAERLLPDYRRLSSVRLRA